MKNFIRGDLTIFRLLDRKPDSKTTRIFLNLKIFTGRLINQLRGLLRSMFPDGRDVNHFEKLVSIQEGIFEISQEINLPSLPYPYPFISQGQLEVISTHTSIHTLAVTSINTLCAISSDMMHHKMLHYVPLESGVFSETRHQGGGRVRSAAPLLLVGRVVTHDF